MANTVTVPVAELLAVMDADTRRLDEAIVNSDVKLANFSNRVLTSQQLLKELSETGFLTARAFRDYTAAVQLVSEEHIKAAEAMRLFSESEQEEARIARERISLTEQEIQSRQEYGALLTQIGQEAYEASEYQTKVELDMSAQRQAMLADELASRQEYAALVKQLTAEQIAGEDALLETYERENEELTRLDIARLAAKEPAAGGGGGGAGGLGSGFSSAGFRIGSNGLNPYFRLGESLKGLTSIIQPVMEVLFPVLLIGLAGELVVDYGKKIIDLTNDYYGLGKASKDAWKEAFDGAVKTREETVKQIEALNSVKAAGLKGSAKDTMLANIDKLDINQLKNKIQATQEELRTLQGKKESYPRDDNYGGITARAITNLYGVTDKESEIDAKIKKDSAELKTLSDDLFARQIDQKKKEKEAAEDATKATKKWHDVIHEYTVRLPWFQGPSTAGNLVGALRSASPNPQGSIFNQLPALSRAVPPNAVTNPNFGQSSESVARTSAGSSSISGIELHYQFNFKFEGIPADVEHFMRDVVEPKFVSDLKDNVRSVRTAVVEALKKGGVKVG